MPQLAPLQPADRNDWLPLWQGYLVFYAEDLADEVTDDVFSRLAATGGDATGVLHGVLVRDEDGTALGFVHWQAHPSTWTRGSYCYLEDLYVDPERRGSGVGRALIAHVRGWAEAQGCDKVYWITAKGNARARTLYDDVATETGVVQYEIPLLAAPESSA